MLAGGIFFWVLLNSLQGECVYANEIDSQPTLQWQEWGPKAFEQAQAEDKLIVLDLTAVWCHACHVMEESTYSHPRIIELLNQHFIPIRVDTDQRPDLEIRYRAGGWPTTNVLLPTGEILWQANALEFEEMEGILLEIRSIYLRDKTALQNIASSFWAGIREKTEIRSEKTDVLRFPFVQQSVQVMKKQYDQTNGGFRQAPKFFEPDAIRMAFAHGFFENDVELIQMGLTTLTKQTSLFDPVWGGFYRYAENADWSHPHYEKILTIQAQNLRNYVEAFQLTGDEQYKRIAVRLVDYVSRFLTDSQAGLFYESQDADVQGTKDGSLLSGAEYFSFNETQRLALGIPGIDKRIFTGSNALMAGVYLHASPVLGKPEMQELALRALTTLFETRFNHDKGLAHEEIKGQLRVFGLLSDHILFGQALLEAYNTTGQARFLKNAEVLAEVNRKLLEDSTKGGFYDHPPKAGPLGLLRVTTKPLVENFQAALWYMTLFHYTGKQEYHSVAEKTLHASVSSLQPLPVALAGYVIDQWFRIPVHIAVVGLRDNPKTHELVLEAQRVYCPGKVSKIIDPQVEQPKWGEITFPFDGRSVAFICTDRICSAPVSQAQAMKDSISQILSIVREALPKS